MAEKIKHPFYEFEIISSGCAVELLVNDMPCFQNYLKGGITVDWPVNVSIPQLVGSVNLPNNTNYTVNLKAIKARLDQHIYKNAAPMRFDNPKDEKILRAIRQNYIHTSAHYSHEIKISGVWYPPHNPRDSYLTREREENDG
ncbi:hypothetical protein Q4603_21595 [Zobellia galactanivorans]|uniref:hypothetical protein n=1 Tax=Zobellia galactanivorans (strain DSM 12802 / CCUG 47099 / CIP 106680 / NCIMB 13871 / Dsij) TaxID=63186 RepID=UPI0026E30745|nr:hypothetical protein [Zobellia galactanivorans]MDO6811226.1 hypothetical protein [Zobellia galactanivorans]